MIYKMTLEESVAHLATSQEPGFQGATSDFYPSFEGQVFFK